MAAFLLRKVGVGPAGNAPVRATFDLARKQSATKSSGPAVLRRKPVLSIYPELQIHITVSRQTEHAGGILRWPNVVNLSNS
jgi:hypothetical protein